LECPLEVLSAVPFLFHISAMRRVDEGRLVEMALAALEEVVAASMRGPPPRTRAIALALAYLWWVAPAKDRWPFDEFWQWMTTEQEIARTANLSRTLNAIHLALGRTRGLEPSARAERENAVLLERRPS
jgi:hypothetical protein